MRHATAEYKQYANLLQHCSQLQRLDITAVQQHMTHVNMSTLLDRCAYAATLQRLALSNFQLSNEDISQLQQLQALTELIVHHNTFHCAADTDVQSVVVGALHSLQQLHTAVWCHNGVYAGAMHNTRSCTLTAQQITDFVRSKHLLRTAVLGLSDEDDDDFYQDEQTAASSATVDRLHAHVAQAQLDSTSVRNLAVLVKQGSVVQEHLWCRVGTELQLSKQSPTHKVFFSVICKIHTHFD